MTKISVEIVNNLSEVLIFRNKKSLASNFGFSWLKKNNILCYAYHFLYHFNNLKLKKIPNQLKINFGTKTNGSSTTIFKNWIAI